MRRHTPGPWFSKNDGKEIHDREMFCDEHGALTGSRPSLIARIEIAPFDIWGNANGALIAAAPDLLEQLEAFATEVWSDCRLPQDMRESLASRYHCYVRPAIAKATGGEPR